MKVCYKIIEGAMFYEISLNRSTNAENYRTLVVSNLLYSELYCGYLKLSFTTTYICHVITDGFFGFVFTSAIFALKTLFVCPNDIAPIAAISTNRKAHMSSLSDCNLSRKQSQS